MREKSLPNIITWILYAFYIVSIGLFISQKNMFNIVIGVACVLLTIVIQIIYKKNSRIINDQLYIVIISFIMISSLLGSCFGFYSINYYDDFLHIWSGFIACSVAYSAILYFNDFEQIKKMNKLFIIIFLLMFSVAVAGFWEITEFSMDTLIGTKTQVGGLKDTMMDMIDGLIGAVIMIPFIIKKIDKIK